MFLIGNKRPCRVRTCRYVPSYEPFPYFSCKIELPAVTSIRVTAEACTTSNRSTPYSKLLGEIAMHKTTVLLAVLLFCGIGPAYALYSVIDRGEWPKIWPRKLEPLRKQSRTLVGPMAPHRHYA